MFAALRDRLRQDYPGGGDPQHGQRGVQPRDEGGQGRPQQQPRGQEPSRAYRERSGSGQQPRRDPRDWDQVPTKTQMIHSVSK